MSGSGASETPRRLCVRSADAGIRLDRFLSERLGISRNEAREILAAGLVAVDGRAVSGKAKGARLAPAVRVEVGAFTSRATRTVPAEPEVPLRVLARGEGWLAVEKPAGVPVHPLRTGERGTLLGAVVARHPEIRGVGEAGLRSGVVHRLDVDTSGVVVFATTQPVFRQLRDAFAAHRIDKRYRAIALGALEGEARVELHLAVARHRPARVRVVDARAGGRRTALRWRALEPLGPATLVEIRVHRLDHRPRDHGAHELVLVVEHEVGHDDAREALRLGTAGGPRGVFGRSRSGGRSGGRRRGRRDRR
ncbi:MAG: hypothetical protein JSU66_12055 [Deltaproteobacteria bacterium]|nr:MAG: hypothetical protein JSU66_12055 [Deltaproteobacteria bacterium]